MNANAHPTYALLRYRPLVLGLPITWWPPLIFLSGLTLAIDLSAGLVLAVGSQVVGRAAFLWNPAAFRVLLVAAVAYSRWRRGA